MAYHLKAEICAYSVKHLQLLPVLPPPHWSPSICTTPLQIIVYVVARVNLWEHKSDCHIIAYLKEDIYMKSSGDGVLLEIVSLQLWFMWM